MSVLDAGGVEAHSSTRRCCDKASPEKQPELRAVGRGPCADQIALHKALALLTFSVPAHQMKLVKINQVLTEDYHCRRQMMIKRFQVTLESFAWGEKTKVGMLTQYTATAVNVRLLDTQQTCCCTFLTLISR